MQVWNVLHAARLKRRTQTFAIWAPSHNFVGLYLHNQGTYRQSEKFIKQQCLPHTSWQYDELRPTSALDLLASLGHPSKFQRVSRLGSVTAWHSSNGRQPKFVALNRERHRHSTGRPSRWALAHISSLCINDRLLLAHILVSYLFRSGKSSVACYTPKMAYNILLGKDRPTWTIFILFRCR